MLIYMIVDLALILMGLSTYQKTNKKWALFLAFWMLLLIAGLRGGFTSDYHSYAGYFLKVRRTVPLAEILSFKSGYSMEKAFVLLLRIIAYLTDSPVVMFTIIGAVTLALFFRGFRKLSVMPVLTVLLFVSVGDYYASFNLVRQILAAALLFLSIVSFTEGKTSKTIMWLLFAALIHRTALVAFPILLLLNRKVTKKNVLIMCLTGVTAYFLLPQIVRYVQSIFHMYSNYSYGMGEGTINAVIPSLGMLVFVAYSIFLGNCDFDLNDRKNRILLNGVILTTLMQFLGLRIYIVSRLAYYLKPCFWILIPNMIAGYRKERERRLILIVLCLFALAFTYITLSGTGYDPYYFVFSKR